MTEELRNGGTLRVIVADGWAIGRFGYFSLPGDTGQYRSEYELIAEVHLEYEDGSSEIIGSDDTWDVRRSFILRSSIYDGEWQDATKDLVHTGEKAKYIEEKVPLTARYSTPVTVHKVISPTQLIVTPKREQVLDLGQNLVGIFQLRVNEKPGTRIHLSFGEVMQEGCFYRENLRTALAEFDYICKGGEEILEPHFTFYGYRYVKVEGVSNLCKENYNALVLYSDIQKIGQLRTGNEKINQLISNIEWGQRGNFVDVPTDCPQRDERLGWTGDTQVFSATANYFRDCYGFYRKYLHDMLTEQQMLDGMVPDIVPSLSKPYQACSSVWGDAACIVPWNVYKFSGDKSILRECYPSMKAWVDYISKLDGEDHGWQKHFHYGDWLALDHPSHDPDVCTGGTYTGYIADIYYANSAYITAKTAEILGKHDEAEKYFALRGKIRKNLQKDFFTPGGRCAVPTQTGLILGIRYSLVEDDTVLRTQLIQLFEETQGKLQTGFTGTPFLLEQLTEIGQERLAYDILMREEYPGWLYAVNLGATTIWERWNSMNPDGSVSSTGMNSFNHYAYGSVAEWMFRYMAGLQQKEGYTGFKNTVIHPVPDTRIGSCYMSYDSAAGNYEVEWRILDKTRLWVRITIPFGCEADIILPYLDKEALHVDAGTYEYEYDTNKPMCREFSVDMTLKELYKYDAVKKLIKEMIPSAANVPDAMQGFSLRECVKLSGKKDLNETIEQLDILFHRMV